MLSIKMHWNNDKESACIYKNKKTMNRCFWINQSKWFKDLSPPTGALMWPTESHWKISTTNALHVDRRAEWYKQWKVKSALNAARSDSRTRTNCCVMVGLIVPTYILKLYQYIWLCSHTNNTSWALMAVRVLCTHRTDSTSRAGRVKSSNPKDL